MKSKKEGSRNLRYERSLFVLDRLTALQGGKVAMRLKSAPMEVRKLGLPLASAGWDSDNVSAITCLVCDWLYGRWGLLPNTSPPQSAQSLLRALQNENNAALFSAAEIEAIDILQAAKALVKAVEEGSDER